MRFFKLFFTFIFVLLITGCGSNNFSCHKNVKSEAGSITYDLDILFDEDTVRRIEMKSSLEINDKYKNYHDILVKSIKSEIKKYGKSGVSSDIKDHDGIIVSSTVFDLNKMNSNGRKYLGFGDEVTRKAIIKYFEDAGYRCE